ncbi:uncharacterized protein TM35_000083410 [Trypanosoma theileri]|uniref:Uncharacterized protein n=1 Tax=Trypanosoma theileri TaxID=67003 RepID=A0A1X0P1G5_9TRYP|nr:uncharacterized protein TM35_000083410 [Trypanosoma theileri]ORC90543.1 hypothetical protein TM35_000083410 [Trypanosoma theileri]
MVFSFSTVADETLVVLIAVCTLISYIVSLVWWSIVPFLFYPEERRLEKRIAQLRAEAELCNSSDHLHLHGKLCRETQQLMKELTRVRQQRFELCRFCKQHKQQTKGGYTGNNKEDALQYCVAYLRCMLPRLVGVFISCGFMIPILYLYGNRGTIVLFPRNFSLLLPLIKHSIEQVMMMLLLSPFMWGISSVEEQMCSGSSGSGSSGSGSSSSGSSVSTGNWAHTNRGISGNFGGSSMMGDGSVTENMIRGVPVSPTAVNCRENEIRGMGVFPWFLTCFVAVRFTHRVLSRA